MQNVGGCRCRFPISTHFCGSGGTLLPNSFLHLSCASPVFHATAASPRSRRFISLEPKCRDCVSFDTLEEVPGKRLNVAKDGGLFHRTLLNGDIFVARAVLVLQACESNCTYGSQSLWCFDT